jgi:hypothetical protein
MAGPEREARGLVFPIKLRCTAPSDLLNEPGLEDALARALGRAFARARSSLPLPISVGAGVSLRQAELVGGGLGPTDAATLLNLINRAIGRAATAQSVPLARTASTSPSAMPGTRESDPATTSPTPAVVADRVNGDRLGISEPLNPMRIDPVAGTYTLPSYDGGKAKVAVRSGGDPFKGIIDLQQQLHDTAWELIKSLKALQTRPSWRNDLEARLVKDAQGWLSDRAIFIHIADVLAGTEKADAVPADVKEEYEKIRAHYAEAGWIYPVRKKIAIREEQLRKNILLYNTIRVQVSELDRLANAATSEGSEQLHDTFGLIAKYYIELPLLTLTVSTKLDWLAREDLLQKEQFSRLAFLVTFYNTPARAAAYAVVAYAKRKLSGLEKNLRIVYASPLNYYSGPALMKIPKSPFTELPESKKSLRSGSEHIIAAIYAIGRYQFIAGAIDGIGDPPGRPEEVTRVPSPALAQTIAAAITHLQVEVAVLALWAPLADVRAIMSAHRIELGSYQKRLETLETAFAGEVKKYPHPTIEADYKRWQDDVTTLLDDVRSTIYWTEIKRAAAGSIPFLILGPLAAEAAGVWVAATISEARWVIALGRAAAVTLVSIALNPPTSFTAKTAGTLGLELAFNFFTEGLGQLFQKAGKLAETSLGMRRALLRLVSNPAISFALTTSSITAAQAIEARATHQGGETSFTELLTINTILNVLGLVIGAALHWPPKAQKGGSITAIELVEFNRQKGITLDPKDAQLLLDLRLKSLAYDQGFQKMAKAAQKGTLTQAEFEAYIDEGKALAKELKTKMPGLAESLKLGITREQIETSLDERIAELDRLKSAGLNAPLQGRPELVSGLQSTGVGPIWTYDPANPPAQLEALRKSYEDPANGHKVRELPGGGWEATDGQGRTVLEVLPAEPKIAGLLPPALKDQVKGEKAKTGADIVYDQTVRLELPSQLAAALRESGESVVRRILQVIARPEFADFAAKDPAVWEGLSNFLRLGGSPDTLARAIWFQDTDGALSAHVLSEMAKWDASSVRGLEGLYRIRPKTTGNQLESLFDGLSSEQSREFFRAIDILESKSRGLKQVLGRALSGDLSIRDTQVQSRHQRGALGEIFRGLKLMNNNPGKIIGFGVDVLVEDPVTKQATLRFFDVAVLEPVPGKPDTPTSLLKILFVLESKETSTGRLDSRAPKELAKDIVIDAQARAATGGGKPFKTFGWGVRSWELEGIATDNLKKGGNANPTTDQIDAEMREIIKKQLRAAFKEPLLKNSLTQTQFDEYSAAFENGLPFVEFD